MFKRKIYSALLMIFCSLITVGNIQNVSNSGAENVAVNDTMISTMPVFTVPGFDLTPSSLQYANEYIEKNSWGLEKLKKRSQSKLGVIHSVFSKHDIPVELKYMAIVESNLNSDTVCNSSGATGIWQLMPSTATKLGLKVSGDVDERLHIYKSSVAAAKYLKQLYAEFGDWLLVIAAYNSGPAKITRAINLSGHKSFWQIQKFLPAETRNHVKRFVSVLYFFEGQNSMAG